MCWRRRDTGGTEEGCSREKKGSYPAAADREMPCHAAAAVPVGVNAKLRKAATKGAGKEKKEAPRAAVTPAVTPSVHHQQL